ncbi:MAG: diguanylate cyclase [Oscillospiraceae bacterium]|nr:diguanylate cyclase [Oscillospiraceae bacterium]MCL2279725.1 diguanylate cyclase [Oscillospiraceae bacterium]
MSEQKNSVLIIDDELENIKALRFILGKDYTVYAERVSKNAPDTVKRLLPDIVLLDVIMPDIDGFEIIGHLKAEKTTKDIPVIFVTGRTDSDDEVKGFSLGAVDYINKPFSAPVVKMRIAHQMRIINQMREIQNLSATDTLTGIGNRRFFNTLINQEWEGAKRQQAYICFILFDIDNFKIFNDTYGHISGDKALKAVSEVITSSLTRATDKAARWGGEEFAIVLPNTPLDGAWRVAENIREAIEKMEIRLDDGNVVGVTVSGGIRCIIPDRAGEYSLEDMFTDADEAMYKAKRSGKNRVCVAE